MTEELVPRPQPRTTENRDARAPGLGDWFHVKEKEYSSSEKKYVVREYLRCVTHVGTNYVELTHANGSYLRVHFDEFDDYCRPEPEADKLIEGKIEDCRRDLKQLMGRVKELTASLAITPQGELPPQQETAALVLQTSATTMEDYKLALVKAKDEQLPALFDEIKKTNERMAMWMKAPMLPLKAQAGTLDGSIDAIKQRVFNVELYAGLVEQVVEVRGGQPASADESVRLHQRRHYMDEECLVDYKHGGMEFANINEFNAWLSRNENFCRILPHPRCVVAFKVRRERKDRGCSLNLWVSIELNELDESTFLYIRNGEQLYMLSTKIDFGDKLFPDLDRNVLSYRGTLWAEDACYGRASSIKGLITDDEYQGLKDEIAKHKRGVAALKRAHAKLPETKDRDENGRRSHELWLANNKVDSVKRQLESYEKFTPESVYFDDISEYVRDRMLEHNRLVLVLQGLFDRSPVFHPHPQYRLWERDGYEAALKLVYDDSRTLTSGDKPSFKKYVEKLQKEIKVGSIVMGQEDAWMRLEAVRENARQRNRDYHAVERTRPYGNPGPGFVARVLKISRDRTKVTFNWTRERMSYSRSWRSNQHIACKIVVPTAELFCVSAYRPGDYKMFFDDPRSRADYLEWAPFLLTAEDYHADKVEVGKPGETRQAVRLDFSNIVDAVEDDSDDSDDEDDLEDGESVDVDEEE